MKVKFHLTCEKVGLEEGELSALSASLTVQLDLVTRPGLNTSSIVLTEGSVLWALSHPSSDEDTGAGGVGVTLMATGVMLMGTGGGGAWGLVILCWTGREGGTSSDSLGPDSDLRYDGKGFSPFSRDLIWLGVRDWNSAFSPSSRERSALIFQKDDSSVLGSLVLWEGLGLDSFTEEGTNSSGAPEMMLNSIWLCWEGTSWITFVCSLLAKLICIFSRGGPLTLVSQEKGAECSSCQVKSLKQKRQMLTCHKMWQYSFNLPFLHWIGIKVQE